VSLARFVPPILADAYRRAIGRPRQHSYQGVTTPFNMRQLHEGRFAEAFDPIYPSDPLFRTDGDLVRLRCYLAHVFAETAMAIRGDYLAAGISYAVVPKVIYELTLKGSGRSFHLLDPLLDAQGDGWCTDPALVLRRFEGDAAVHLHQRLIPDAFPLPLPNGLAFVHLDTSNEDAELASLPYLVAVLNPGGVMVMDSYGFGDFAERYDAVAADLGQRILAMPSGQGVLIKFTTAGAESSRR
jgi:hypothetical protein